MQQQTTSGTDQLKATMMTIISLLTGGLLLLLGLLDLSDLHQTLQARNKAEYTGVLAEFHCSSERKQSAVKLRLAQHPPSTWFHSNRDLLGQFQTCKVLQQAASTQAHLTFVASRSQILRLSIGNQLIYQIQDWRKHQLKDAISLTFIGALLAMSGCYGLYRRRRILPENAQSSGLL